jgi:hypothetical protein
LSVLNSNQRQAYVWITLYGGLLLQQAQDLAATKEAFTKCKDKLQRRSATVHLQKQQLHEFAVHLSLLWQ